MALDFGGNPNHVTLGLRLGKWGPSHNPQYWVHFIRRLINSNNFAGSAASAEVVLLYHYYKMY